MSPAREMRGARSLALAALLTLTAAPGGAAAQERRCEHVVTPAVARRLFDHIVAVRGQDACRFDGIRTQVSRMELAWKADDVALAARVEPTECATPGGRATGAYTLHADAALEERCPATYRALLDALGDSPSATGNAEERGSTHVPRRARVAFAVVGLLVVALLVAGALRARKPLAERLPVAGALAALAAMPLTATGALDGNRVFALCALLMTVALALTAGLALRASRGLRAGGFRDEAAWALAGVAALALVARFAVRPSLANWYAEVLAADAPATSGRFGPGFPVLQAALRAALPWSDHTLTTANAFVGAMAAPLLVALALERGLAVRAAASAGVLLALSPFHARISATPSEHVLASTLTLALMLAWTRGVRTRDPALRALALVLVPCATLTRADAWYALGAVPLWALARDRDEHGGEARRTDRFWDALAFTAVWLLTGAWAWAAVVVPSRHPMPELRGMVLTTRQLLPQFIALSTGWPRWIPVVLPALALVGVLRMVVKRPALLACVALSLVVGFIPLGRSLLYDELLSARYFLVMLAVAALPAAVGFEWITAPLARRPGRAGELAALGALAVAALALTLPAWSVRYTFEDEYAFLRRESAKLPDGCTVYQLQLRDGAFERDLDCCLDAPRSPLVIARPRVHFATLDGEAAQWRPEPARPGGCLAYYESAACGMRPTPEARARHARAYEALMRRCEAARTLGTRRPVAAADVSARSTNSLFGSTRPRVGLWRWEPPATDAGR